MGWKKVSFSRLNERARSGKSGVMPLGNLMGNCFRDYWIGGREGLNGDGWSAESPELTTTYWRPARSRPCFLPGEEPTRTMRL